MQDIRQTKKERNSLSVDLLCKKIFKEKEKTFYEKFSCMK